MALSHLGVEKETAPYNSYSLIENTRDIDIVLDAHSHTTIECEKVAAKDGDSVLLSQTGTKLENLGELIIPQNGGEPSISLISDYNEKDEETAAFIAKETAIYEEEMNKVVAKTNVDLLCTDENGIRMIRSREMALGDLVADAYRKAGNADIGLCNGGGIREADIDDIYVVMKPEQVKLVDEMTYADDGSIIPAEARFDWSNRDIRWSIAAIGGQDSGRTTAILAKHPNAVAFCGHKHRSATEERLFWQGAFTAVEIPSLFYAIETWVPKVKCDHDAHQALFMTVYGDRIVIERLDVTADKKLADDWVISLKK